MSEQGRIKDKKKAEAQNLEFDMNLLEEPVIEEPFRRNLVSVLRRLTRQLLSKKASATKK